MWTAFLFNMSTDLEDMEVECAFNNQLHVDDERATTPPNRINVSFESCLTPVSNHSNLDNEGSFIKRIGMDRFNRGRSTSTPVQMILSKGSYTVPNIKQVMNIFDPRQSRSVDSHTVPFCNPDQIMYEYANPFTPDGKLFIDKAKAHKKIKNLHLSPLRKFTLPDSDTSSEGVKSMNDIDFDIPTRHRLNELNVYRFNEEFVILETIGSGDHGRVFKCMNRINGCIYAVKKTNKPIKSSIQEHAIRNEIYAHGVLHHNNVVRNFSCWKEEGYVFIQNEFCNGGNLEDYIKGNMMQEPVLRSLLLQMSRALRYMHIKGLAHLDVKPGNIFLCFGQATDNASMTPQENGEGDTQNEILFKLGDLGHVAKIGECQDVEEGDCRYLPREILEDKLNHLDRADTFALGLTVYEAAGAGPLPKNGESWHHIRQGNLTYLHKYSEELNKILRSMVQPVPEKRPTAEQLIQILQPNGPDVPEDVFGYIEQYRYNNKILEQKVEATDHYLKYLVKSHKHLQLHLSGKDKVGKGEKLLGIAKKKGAVTKNRIIGKKTKRSSSTTIF